MTQTPVELFNAAANNVAKRLDKEYQILKDKELKDISDASKDHSPLPDHYWMERHRAEQLARASKLILDALKDDPNLI